MTEHEMRCLIAKHSADPTNAEAMALAAYYARILVLMTDQPTAETETAA